MAAVKRETKYTLELSEHEYLVTRAAWTLLWERDRSPVAADLLELPPELRIQPPSMPAIEQVPVTEGTLPTAEATDVMEQRRAEAARIAAAWGNT